MPTVSIHLNKEQYAKISSIADEKYHGNFSKAVRGKMGIEVPSKELDI